MLKIPESNVIASASEQLAMESNMLSNLVTSIVKFLPSVLNQASVAFSGFNKESSEAKHAGSVNIESLTRRENALLSQIVSSDFADMTNFGVPVGVGFRGSLNDYADTVLAQQKYYQTDTVKHLQDYYVYLSVLVSNKDARQSLKEQTRMYQDIEKERAGFDKSMKSYFGTGTSNTVQYTKGVDSHNEFVSYMSKLTAVCKIDDLRERKAVSDLIEKISMVCNAIIEQSTDGTISHITPEVTKNIHDGMLAMAKLVESYGFFIHHRTEMVASRSQLIEKLEKRFL